jgi:hypothetical protein
MRKAARHLGGVVSSNPCRWRGKRLHHHGGGVCWLFVLLWMDLWCHETIICKKWYKNNPKEGLCGVTFLPALACTTPILETLFCIRKRFSATVLPQDEYWSLTIMQQFSPWDSLSEIRLTTQYSRRNRFNQTARQNQAQYSSKILTTNIVIGVQSISQELVPSANASY